MTRGSGREPSREPGNTELGVTREVAGELWAGHFQHLGTLSIAAAAGTLVLLQAGVFAPTWTLWAGLGGFVMGTAAAADGEFKVIDSFASGPVPLARLRLYRALVWGFIALGFAGVFAASSF